MKSLSYWPLYLLGMAGLSFLLFPMFRIGGITLMEGGIGVAIIGASALGLIQEYNRQIKRKRTILRFSKKWGIDSSADMGGLLKNFEHHHIAFIQRVAHTDSGEITDSWKGHRDEVGILSTLSNKRKEALSREGQRAWSLKGMQLYSEIAGTAHQDMNAFSAAMLQFITHYLEVEMGVMYLKFKNPEGEGVEVAATYAVSIPLGTKILSGVGLVGQCIIEKENQIIENISSNYQSVSSGLGELIPAQILIFPLVREGELQGIIELASLAKIAEHKLEFLDQLTDNIAYFIDSRRKSEHVTVLLESSRHLTEDLKKREEELQVNLQELQSVQEEMERRQINMDNMLTAISDLLLIIEADKNWDIVHMNTQAREVFDANNTLKDYNLKSLLKAEGDNLFDLSVGGFFEVKFLSASGRRYYLSFSRTAIYGNSGLIDKILILGHDVTNEREKALDTDFRLQAISKSTLMLEYDPNGIIVSANDNFLDSFHYDKKSVLGKARHELFGLQGNAKERDHKMWELLKVNGHMSVELETMDGLQTPRTLEERLNVISDSEGRAIRYIEFAQCVTESRNLEKIKTLQDAELHSNLEAIGKTLATVDFDKDGFIQNASPIFLNVLGYSMEDIIGRDYTYLLPASELEKPQTVMLWENLRNGQFFQGEFAIKDKHGNEHILSGTYNPLYDGVGNISSIKMMAYFITKEKNKIHELNEMVKGLSEGTNIIEMSSELRFKGCNESFTSQYGYRKLDLLKKSLIDLIDVSKLEVDIERIIDRVLSGLTENVQLHVLDKDGVSRDSHLNFFPVSGLSRQIVKIMVLVAPVIRETGEKMIGRNGNI